MRVLAVLAGFAAVLGLALFALLDGRRRPGAVATPTITSRLEESQVEQQSSRSGIDAPKPEPPPTIAQVLEEHWGENWPAVEERIRAADAVDLDAPGELLAWEDVSEKLRERVSTVGEAERKGIMGLKMRWPEELTSDWVRSTFRKKVDLDPIHLGEIEDLAAVKNAELEATVEHYIARLELAVDELWNNGEFRKVPFTTAALPESGVKRVFGRSAGYGGWCVHLEVPEDRFPDLGPIEEDIRALRAQRNELVSKYLSSLKD